MKDTFKFVSFLLLGVLIIVAGILIITHQEIFVKIIVVCAGIGLLADGVFYLFNLAKWHFEGVTKTMTLIKSITNILAGLMGIIMPLTAAEAAVKVIVFIFAGCLIFSAVISIENAIVFKKYNQNSQGIKGFITSAIISILIAVVLFSDPWKVASALVLVIGIFAEICGLCVIVWAIRVHKLMKNAVVEVEVVDK